MKKMLFKVVSLVLTCVIILESSTAYASETAESTLNSETLSQLEESFEEINAIAMKTTDVNDQERIAEVKSIVEAAVKENIYSFNFGENGTLLFDDISLLDIENNDDIYTSITIPVKGINYSLLSNVTFILKDDQILAYTETLITRGSNNKFVVDIYYDGALIESNHTNIEYISDEEIQEGLNSLKGIANARTTDDKARGANEIAGCLAVVAGVNITVALLITSTCVASCPAVVPICVACITAVGSIGAADVAALVKCFDN